MANGTSGPVPGHRILLEERSRLTITGVTDVLSFDEESVTAETDLGTLTVRGEGLHISRLDLDEGLLRIEGSIDAADDGRARRHRLCSRLLRQIWTMSGCRWWPK